MVNQIETHVLNQRVEDHTWMEKYKVAHEAWAPFGEGRGGFTDIIQSGIKAPSSKNGQPWKYIVIQGKSKEEILKVFRQGIEREENESALLQLRNKVNEYGKMGKI